MAYYNRFANFEPNNEADRGWNLAQLFCNRIDIVTGLIDESLKINDLVAVYRLLKRIHNKISYLVLRQPEKMLFEKTYKSYYDEINTSFTKLHQLIISKQADMNVGVIQLQLDEIDKYLHWLLWDLNLIFPAEQHKSWEQELKEEFE